MPGESICIFCETPNHEETVEHIVPRSLGNLHYILPKGKVCKNCNQRFSHYENHVLSSHLFLEERRKYGLLRQRNNSPGHELSSDIHQKFLLKLGYEALFYSRKNLWQKYNFDPLIRLLLRGQSDPLFSDRPNSKLQYKSIPRWIDRFRLRNNHLSLEYAEDQEKLFFRFQFGRIRSAVRVD